MCVIVFPHIEHCSTMDKHPYVKIFLKISACFIIAAAVSAGTTGLVRTFYKGPFHTSPPPPCPLQCQNEGICIHNRCRCSEYYTGELCMTENFCKSSSHLCDNSSNCYEFGIILAGMYGYSNERCENTTINANTPVATVQCVNNGGSLNFGPIRTQNCNENLETLAMKTEISTENAKNVSATTQILTSEPETLQAENITNAIKIVNKLLTLPNTTEEVGQSAVATVSQILGANDTEFKNDKVQVNETESLTRQMEAYSLNSIDDTLSVVQPSVAVEKRTLSARSQNGIMFMSLKGLPGYDNLTSNRVIVDINTSEFVFNETADVQLFLKPSESADSDVAVGFVLYQNDYLFRSKHRRALTYRKRVISANISNGIHANVEFSFSKWSDPSYSLIQYACVYWDYNKSEWNTAGCVKQSLVNDTSLRCACYHTTNFAVLMNFRKEITHPELDTVSTVGCILSLVGLSATVVFLLYARFRKKEKNSWILISLCSAMLIFYILFIGTMEYSTSEDEDSKNDNSSNRFLPDELYDPPQSLCAALAVLLHYFLLTSFTLTAMLAGEMYIRFISVSHFTPEHFLRSALIIGWGLPAIIVLISFGATYRTENEKNNYHRKDFCWLAGVNDQLKLDLSKPLLWSFLVPVGIILIANICIFIAVSVKSIWRNDPLLTSTRKKYSVLKKTLATISVATLLGITWIFGYLMLIETKETTQIIFSFIFCICCGTQGIQIFIFYTLRSPLFLEKVVAGIRLFNSCKIYMHSKKYRVNRIRKQKTQFYQENFRNLSESTAQLFSDDKKSEG